MAKISLIKKEDVNSRLDRWFKRNITNVPQSLIEKNIRKGNIKVNDIKRKSSYKLQENDKISLKNIKFVDKNKNVKKFRYEPNNKDLEFSSELFIENNLNFVVINKPAGIAVQSGTKSKKNIIDILRNTKEFNGFTPYTVHRIDKETTGLLIVAKNRKYAQLFTSLFRIRKVHKNYLAVVVGEVTPKKDTLINELVSYENDKKVFSKAITHYSVLDYNNKYSLLKLNPQTGRKHQLRKQLLIIGNPILGDEKYRISRNSHRQSSLLMLHAYKINFSINNIKYNFTAEIPKSFKDVLDEKYLKIRS